MAMSMAIIFYPPFQWQCQYQFLYPAKSMAISMSIFLKSNFNVNVNTNCFSSKISMSMAMSMLEIHLNQCQFFVNQWPFRLINFNGNVNFSKIPFSIPMAISIFLGSPSQLSMAISMPPKRSMSMARQYYCSCLLLPYSALLGSVACQYILYHQCTQLVKFAVQGFITD